MAIDILTVQDNRCCTVHVRKRSHAANSQPHVKCDHGRRCRLKPPTPVLGFDGRRPRQSSLISVWLILFGFGVSLSLADAVLYCAIFWSWVAKMVAASSAFISHC